MKLKYAIIFRTDLLKPLFVQSDDFLGFLNELRWMVEKYGAIEMIYSLNWP